jgi:Fibronectin type III domain
MSWISNTVQQWWKTRFPLAFRANRQRSLRPRFRTPALQAAQVETLESRALLTVTYHGGALLTAVEAQAVYLGSDWKSNASLQSQTTQLDQFVGTIVNSPYMDMLSNAGYNVGRGTASTGAIANLTLSKTASVGVTDAQIQSDLQSLINSGQLQTPDANRLYIVYVEPGVVIHAGTDASNTTFLGYHGAFAGKTSAGKAADIHYAVIAYPGSPNFSSQSQGFSSDFNDLTAVASHELAEAVTDPNVDYKTLGWYDDKLNGEIGDLTRKTTLLGSYLVQDVVGQNDQVITPASSTTTSLSAPTLTAQALDATDVQLTWTASSGNPTGYRILETIGSTTTTLTVNASTTSYHVSNLAAGSTVSFQVEVYDASNTADSNIANVTLPLTSPTSLTAPKVTGVAQSPYTALLSWGKVVGAQGYNIYYWDGFEAVYLGTVSSGSTSVQIVGLTPNSTTKFLVEAFSGVIVADSSWVSVKTPSTTRHRVTSTQGTVPPDTFPHLDRNSQTCRHAVPQFSP